MLQRIQSVWLLLASICSFATLRFPFYMGTDKTGIPSSTLDATDHFLLIIFTIAIGVTTLLTIFLFKNRGIQIKFIAGSMVLECVLIILYYNYSGQFTEGHFVLTSIFHLFILLFLFLAIRGIIHDNKIVKESNRLR
ncbi:MAG TPA: DUF4293 family protein [Ferruginibacter sp.]|jgi:hypothetical protein|nr:DUF4293 family protein [Chitinophagaceae bacterium]HMT95571.1 DUF4293 family protein [Ferruginibacter sp.]HMU23683.1 DUF4293 family protein [Ferruginibacter sp.]